MRWRLYIFAMSATAIFCFMLLTAVTDYGPHPGRSASGALNATVRTGTLSAQAGGRVRPDAAPPAAAKPRFDPTVRPNPVQFFVRPDADPVLGRLEAEREQRAGRGKPAYRNLLKWDENGWHREEVALVTAYCPCARCCGSQSSGVTSTGKSAWTPGLAAEPDYLNYGTKVLVPGYGLAVVDDTGGAMRRHWRQNGLLHIDVRMTYHNEARRWGKQYLRVKIYAEE